MYGLAVIVALCFYIWFAIWVAKKLSSYRESKQWKWGISTATAFIFILIPTADSILGHLYFSHLCSTEAGVKLYKTVELPPEYWDKRGEVKFPSIKGNYVSSYKENHYSRFFNIDRCVYGLNDKSGNALVEDVVFRNWGGWVASTLSPQNTAASCGAGTMNVVFKHSEQ